MAELTHWVLESIRAHGSLSVMLGVLIESVIVPIPSPLIIMGAGAILIRPELSWTQALSPILLQIVLPGSLAATGGAFVGYAIGFWGGRTAIERFQRFFGFGWADVQAMEARLRRREAGWLIAALRAAPIVPLSLISIALGMIRWPVGSFAGWTWLGSVPRCLLLAYLGWLTRDAYQGLAYGLDRVETAVSILLLLVTGAGIFWLRRRFRSQHDPAQGNGARGRRQGTE